MLEGILKVLDAEQLWICLIEELLSPRLLMSPKPSIMDLVQSKTSTPPVVPDIVLLKKLVPAELYKQAMQSGWMGLHALSFALRHRVTQLQMIFHSAARQSSVTVDPVLRDHLKELWRQMGFQEVWPVFGFSAIGVHAGLRLDICCRAYDAFTIPECAVETTELFCTAHTWEAYWQIEKPTSNQAVMFAFYSQLNNFTLYEESDLDLMTKDFWSSMQRFQPTPHGSLQEALQQFGWTDKQQLGRSDITELRRRFLQLSLQHHPDRGGQDQAFILLQTHYRQLKSYLESLAG